MTIEELKSKIYDDNNKPKRKYTGQFLKYIQKYLTPDELKLLKDTFGGTVKSQIEKLKDVVSTLPSKKDLKPIRVNGVKRKVLYVKRGDDFFQFRNDNIKMGYTCEKCGKEVITSYTTLNHFMDFLCKPCRKNKEPKGE